MSGEHVVKLLIAAADSSFRESMRAVALKANFVPLLANSIAHAQELFSRSDLFAGIFDHDLPDGPGTLLGKEILKRDPNFPFVIVNGPADYDPVIETWRSGAADYFPAPTEAATVLGFLSEFRVRSEATHHSKGQGRLIGNSAPMSKLRDWIGRYAPTPYPVLIVGETGTGKELVAREIHDLSKRAGRFVAVNCGELTPSLIETELFGHERGAFTGADKVRDGLFVAADHGTLFLDEIGELPIELQPRLLRALQDGEIRRVGSSATRKVDVRVLSATNRDIQNAVREKTFREDLLYRLNVLQINVPPLRQRLEDIPQLVEFFLEEIASSTDTQHALAAAAMEYLIRSKWPGNVRELKHAVQRACALALAAQVTFNVMQEAKPPELTPTTNSEANALANAEKQIIMRVLEEAGGNRTEAARRLGIAKSTLYRKAPGLSN